MNERLNLGILPEESEEHQKKIEDALTKKRNLKIATVGTAAILSAESNLKKEEEEVSTIESTDNLVASSDYIPTKWNFGDTITASKLNNAEQGISKANARAMTPGPQGKDGKSAYQVWVDQGNKGTEKDFLNTIKGSDGTIAKYSPEWFELAFSLYRTDKEYGIKIPLWETDHTSQCEKILDNAGLVAVPSTSVKHGQDDYDNIMGFCTWDVNASVDDNGVRHVTAMKGDNDFNPDGDVFVLGMSYYERWYEENGYAYYIRRFTPADGFTPCREAINKDGSVSPYFLIAKYAVSVDNGMPYSKRNKLAAVMGVQTISYRDGLKLSRNKGKYYSLGCMCDYKYIQTTFFLKYGTINSQLIMGGATSYYNTTTCTVATNNKPEAIIAKANKGKFSVGSYIALGTSTDRGTNDCYSLARSTKILSIKDVDADNTALELDTSVTTTTATTVTTTVYQTGFSENVLGRCGVPCIEDSDIKSGRFPIVFQGIEFAYGFYEVAGNAFMDIPDNTGKRDLYICNDSSKLVADPKKDTQGYVKSISLQPTSVKVWGFITNAALDTVNGAFFPTASGAEGSGSSVGYGDGTYSDDGTGTRQVLLLGLLSYGSLSGLACLFGGYGLGSGSWYVGGRLSVNAVGGVN